MNGDERYDAVILATPANVAGELLDGVDHELARSLLDITYSSSVTVTMGYYKEQWRSCHPASGSWCRAARACVCCLHVRPQQVPPSRTGKQRILRCFLGGARDEAILGLSDEEMLETVQREIRDW